jgi:hypothetical protein
LAPVKEKLMDEKRDQTRPDTPGQPTNPPVESKDVQTQPADEPRETAASQPAPQASMPAGRQGRTVLVDGATRSEFERRWNSVQGEFVDDPRRAVADAGSLMAELLDRLRGNLTQRGSELERDAEVDTEQMRMELRQYRALVHTILHGEEAQPVVPPRPPAPADRRPSAMNG